MDAVKKIMGIVWIAMGLYAGYYFGYNFGYTKLVSGKQDDLIAGIIYLFVLTPIIVGGLTTFGLYSLQGLYAEENQ